jgi:hypothetical protein
MISKRVEPPIEVDTDRGRALIFWMLDYTMNLNIVWGCIIKSTGEIWWYENHKIRHAPCETSGIRLGDIKPKESIGELKRRVR